MLSTYKLQLAKTFIVAWKFTGDVTLVPLSGEYVFIISAITNPVGSVTLPFPPPSPPTGGIITVLLPLD